MLKNVEKWSKNEEKRRKLSKNHQKCPEIPVFYGETRGRREKMGNIPLGTHAGCEVAGCSPSGPELTPKNPVIPFFRKIFMRGVLLVSHSPACRARAGPQRPCCIVACWLSSIRGCLSDIEDNVPPVVHKMEGTGREEYSLRPFTLSPNKIINPDKGGIYNREKALLKWMQTNPWICFSPSGKSVFILFGCFHFAFSVCRQGDSI